MDFMDYQIMTDFLISNTDRHMNNISVIRNPDTLKLLGFAPIYDSGNSMFYNHSYTDLMQVRIGEIKTHSFLEKEVRLLQYVSNRSAVDLDKAVMSFDIYRQDVPERLIRISRLQELYESKLSLLESFQNGIDIWKDRRSSSRRHS